MDVVNRTACYFAVLYCFIILCKSCFGINGSHAKERRHPHPEDSARTAADQGSSSTRQVSGTYLGCDGSSNRLEGSHFSFFFLMLLSDTAEYLF